MISGCSGGGKSTLLAELARRGYAVVEEPGRRIVQEELASNGTALPWIDTAAFVRRLMDVALADLDAASRHDLDAASRRDDWVFFDRGLIDAASALQHVTGEPALEGIGQTHRYHRRVFLTPPWPEIYATDAERRHDMDAAIAEYERLTRVYPLLGYDVITLPKIPVVERADLVLQTLSS